MKIAILEADNVEVRRLSAYFIETRFEAYYYGIFKSTFTPAEWPGQVTKMLERYGGKAGSYFNDSKASVFIAENDASGLLDYVEAYLTAGQNPKLQRTFCDLVSRAHGGTFSKGDRPICDDEHRAGSL